MVVLSPSAYAEHSTFRFVQEEFDRLLIHELIHMFEEYLSPNIEASPRWWGEGLAVYFSEQWIYDDDFRQPALTGISQNQIPCFRQVASENKFAYEWGWTIVKFIEDHYGKGMILQIIQECDDGDVFSFVGEDVHLIEKEWENWLLVEGIE